MTMTPLTPVTDRPVVDPRIWTRRVAVTRARGRRRLRIVIAVVVACLLAIGAFAALHSGLFGARHLTVRGADHTPASIVISAAGLARHPPLIDIDPTLSVERIEALPWIRTAQVAVHWPDSVTVVVTERTAVAAVEVPGGSGYAGSSDPGVSWALVDGTGRVLTYQIDKPSGLLPMQVVVDPGRPGTYLPTADQAGVSVAATLPSVLVRRVQSIQVTPGTGVTLGISGGFSAIVGGAEDLTAKFEALASVLAGATLQNGDVINVTVPDEPAVGPGNSRG
jgi:cell division protein FtsQ